MRFIFSIFIAKVLCVPRAPEFLIVKGGFGDPWKDSVLSGEYKLVSNPNKYEVSGTTGGRPIYEKRRKNEFEMFIRFETLDNSWYFQAKEHLTGRINYAHFTCSQESRNPAECQIATCQTFGTSSWIKCPGVSIQNGGTTTREADIREEQLRRTFQSIDKHPEKINVEGLFGDEWKDTVLLGRYKLVHDLKVANTGGRPVYKKLDNTDFYINYYDDRGEWGFRNAEALGKQESYAYLKPLIETHNPTQINSVEFICQVYKAYSNGDRWNSCTETAEGKPNLSITASDWGERLTIIPSNDSKPVLAPLKIATTTEKTTTVAHKIIEYKYVDDVVNNEFNPDEEIIYTLDINDFRQREKYTTFNFDASYKDSLAYCQGFAGTIMADFNGMELELDQRWLISYEPWSNVRKVNGRWVDGNGKNKPYSVMQRKPWHSCAFYKNGQLYSEDCQMGYHKLVCEFTL